MNVSGNKAIGISLQSMRKKQGLTQAQLAERLNKPQSYVSKIEMGERSLHVSELFAYSDALGLSAQDVVARLEKVL